MMASYLEHTLEKIKEFEGPVPWMYVDNAGRVMVGAGMLLPDAAAALHLPFQIRDRAATEDEIAAEFTRVDVLPMGRPALFYFEPGGLRLEFPMIDTLLRTALAGIDGELRDKIAGYAGFPDEVKIALLDMAYSLTPERLLNEYPRLIRAVEEGAWTQAAAESFRNGPGRSRNQWTSAMLRGDLTPGIKAAPDGTLKRLGYGIVGMCAALATRLWSKRQR